MLTEAEIDSMPAGWDLDVLIDEHIFDTPYIQGYWTPPYSREWEYTGKMIDKIIEENWWSDYGGDFFLENWQDDEWVCCNRASGDSRKGTFMRDDGTYHKYLPVFYAVGKTPMEAVSKAALKAKLGLKSP